MNLMQLNLADLVGMLVAFMFTLFIFSYIFGDNALFRVAIYIFIGVSAGYAAVVAWYNVVWPQLLRPLVFGSQSDRLFVLFPLILGGLMALKISPRFSRLGNPAVAYLVGVGVAAAIGGAIIGTIFPQVTASINLFDTQAMPRNESPIWTLTKAVTVLIGTLATLLFFHFGAVRKPNQLPKRPEWLEWIALVGQIFIAMTFGALFAGVFAAALTALIERIFFIFNFVASLL
jgi:hypothetical protein